MGPIDKMTDNEHASNQNHNDIEIGSGDIMNEIILSQLFDTLWYKDNNPDVVDYSENELTHYLRHGSSEGRSPHPLFDNSWYLLRNDDVVASNVNPLIHYIRYGWKEGRDPHPLFHTKWYLDNYGEHIPAGINPLTYYIISGWKEGHWPNSLFDGQWYLDQYGAQLSDRQTPLAHYQDTFATNMPNPNAIFDTKYYMRLNTDVTASRRSALEHYIYDGAREGRDPHRLFFSAWYAKHNQGWGQYGTPLAHFIHSKQPNRFPNPLFDVDYYREQYADVRRENINPLAHYLLSGWRQRRNPSALFDTGWYLDKNSDVADANVNPLEHFFEDGAFEGRAPHPRYDHSWYMSEQVDPARPNQKYLTEWLSFGRARGEESPIILRHSTRPSSVTLSDLCNIAYDESADAKTIDITFSILTPTYNTKPEWLLELYQTLRNQTYGGWTWIISDDGSTRSDTLTTLQAISRKDERVIIDFDETGGGISRATNRALAISNSDYVALVDHDDLLSRHALSAIRAAIKLNEDVEIIYTDECKLASDGSIYDIFLKPAWSPVLLENTMYIGHLTSYKTSFIKSLGGFRSEFDGTQDYDLALRAKARASHVIHVPSICYIWRAVPGSTAFQLTEKDYAIAVQRKAIQEASLLCASNAVVKPGYSLGFWRTDYPLPDDGKRVSFVIPTAGGTKEVRGKTIDLVCNCIESLEKTQFYRNSEYIVVHNGDLTRRQTAHLLGFKNLKLVEYKSIKFNLSEKINLGVEEAEGPYVCLLNDDIETITERGGEIIVGFMEAHPGVGAMAPLCLFENGTVQHDGVLLLEQGPSHAGLFQRPENFNSNGYLSCRREMIGVSGAMLFVKRETYLNLGGFDEGLPLNYNDVDFCLKLRRAGLSCVVDPDVRVFHFESASKIGVFPCEKEELYRRWPGIKDPYFNSAYDQRNPGYVVNFPRASRAFSDPVTFSHWLDKTISLRSAQQVPRCRPLVTIAVAIFNGPRRQLQEMLFSIDLQTYKNTEIIIVDDGSTHPETIAWLDQIQVRPDIRVLRLPKNVGIAGAQKVLLEAARGEWFIPIDSDDFITVDAVQIMLHAADSKPEGVIFYSDEYKSDVQSSKFHPFFKTSFDPIRIMNCCYVTHLMMIRTDFLKNIGSYDDNKATWCHDWDTTLRAVRFGAEPVFVPELLYAWRINPGSTASMETSTKPEAVKSQRFVLEREISKRGLSHCLAVKPNMLGPQTGMWSLVAQVPVAQVKVVNSIELWNHQGGALRRQIGELAEGDGWLALLSSEDKQEREENLLALSAIAHWDERVGVVGGVLVKEEGRVLWSGGVFTAAGVVDPFLDEEWVAGGYHGALYCQRCVDVVAPADVLVRKDRLRDALNAIDHGNISATAGNIMIILGMLAQRSGWLIAVSPYVKRNPSRSEGFLVPLDRHGIALGSEQPSAYSRWYGSHLDPSLPFVPVDRFVEV